MLASCAALLVYPSLGGVAAIRLLAGAGEAAFVIGAYTVITDIAPNDRRGEAMSLVTVGSYGGLIVGPVLANVLLDGGGFRLAWSVAAACAAIAVALTLALPETRPELGADAPQGWLPPRPALLPGLVLLFALVGFGGFNAFVALYARELGFARPGLVFALFGAVIILVRGFGRKIPDRLGARRAAAVACVCAAAGLGTVGAWRSAAGLLVGTVIFAVGQSLAYPAVTLLAIERSTAAERSAVVGAVSAFVDVALALGALTLGAVAEVAGYEGAFLAAAVSAVLGLLVVARVGAPQPHPQPQPQP